MGLTIHYRLRARGLGDRTPADAAAVVAKVKALYQRALDLPFKEIGEVVDLSGSRCDFEAQRKRLQGSGSDAEDGHDPGLFWLLVQAGKYVRCPWNRHTHFSVAPDRIVAFSTWPGEGCEAANFGLCLYPETIRQRYRPEDDLQFFSKPRRSGRREALPWPIFNHEKWSNRCHKHFGRYKSPSECEEYRAVPTKLGGWRWGSFCKTQYASDPECGGVENFLRCHLTVVALLDAARKLKLLADVHDEGGYWEQRDPQALVAGVGEWNEMIAAMVGQLKDRLGGAVESPILTRPDFEHLEARGNTRLKNGASDS